MINTTAFMADSVQDFMCTMGACEDNCCRNTTWTIHVDSDTYEKYKNYGGELGEHILSCIDATHDNKGYKFKEFDHGHCPLLTDEGLCYIHRNLGEEYLCTTCASYPRIWESFNGKAEYWLSLSCPDAIRHVLYRKKKITFLPDVSVSIFSKIPPAEPFSAEKYDMRDFLISITQHRKFSIKEKLLLMGLFMRTASKLPKNDSFAKSLRDLKTAYRGYMGSSGFLDTLISDMGEMHPENRKDYLKIVTKTAAAAATPPKKIPEGITNADYYRLMVAFHEDVMSGGADEYIVDVFDRLIVPYVNANTYVFENYLAYSIVSTRFVKEADDFASAYAGFAGEFISMLAFTAGMFHKNEKLTHDEMIIGMYLFHRKVSHALALRKRLAEIFSNDILTMLLGSLGGIR